MAVKEPSTSTSTTLNGERAEPPAPQDRRAAAFMAEISRDLLDQRDEVPAIQRVTESAVAVVPACDHGGIFLKRRRHEVEAVAPTSELARTCDVLQHEVDEGPCLDALWDDEICLVDDTLTDTRWPRWAPRVAATGIRSVLSVRLGTSTETIGALNLYAEEPHAFTRDDIDVALVYALHASGALSAALMVDNLQHAMESRHTIGVAQGILMHRYDLSMAQSFEVLRRYSSHTNIKLREIAESIVHTGDLPEGQSP